MKSLQPKALKYGITRMAFVSLLTMLSIDQAAATTFNITTIKCPVGGQEFEGAEFSSYSIFGARPDGRPYGTLEVFPLPECPDNGFLIFDEKFTAEEISKLERILETTEYKDITATETPYYRAWWLANAIGRSKVELANLLLQASWETDEDLVRKRRYQERFTETVDAISSDGFEDPEIFWLALRNANAYRELGEFEQSKDRLDQLMDPLLWPTEPGELQALAFLIKGLTQLIEEKNPKSEPVNFMPEDMGYFHCKDNPDQTGIEAKTCAQLSDLDYRYDSDDYDSSVAEAAAEAAEAAAEAAASAAASLPNIDD